VAPRVCGLIAPTEPSQLKSGQSLLWKLRTGAPWRELPERYGPCKTCYERLRVWTFDGTWDKVLAAAQVKDDSVGAVEWVVSIDSAVSRAHQHAAGARKRGAPDRLG
jgi:transposase